MGLHVSWLSRGGVQGVQSPQSRIWPTVLCTHVPRWLQSQPSFWVNPQNWVVQDKVYGNAPISVMNFYLDALPELYKRAEGTFQVHPGCWSRSSYKIQWLWWKDVSAARRKVYVEQGRPQAGLVRLMADRPVAHVELSLRLSVPPAPSAGLLGGTSQGP